MRFRCLDDSDWQQFLRWAEIEGWRVSFQEQRLFQNQWRPYFFSLYHGGNLCGFVSAVAYKQSGWIGNLLVPEHLRGRGYGSALFDYALQFLQQAQLPRIWLTASVSGEPIYTRRGFVVLDRIDRWVAQGKGRQEFVAAQSLLELIELDRACWGESRAPLLNALADDAALLSCGTSLALLQPGADCWQLGPWLSTARDAQENRQLLQQALARTAPGKELLIDVLASAGLELVLRNCGLEKRGSNQLMLYSEETVELSGVMALASLGSIG